MHDDVSPYPGMLWLGRTSPAKWTARWGCTAPAAELKRLIARQNAGKIAVAAEMRPETPRLCLPQSRRMNGARRGVCAGVLAAGHLSAKIRTVKVRGPMRACEMVIARRADRQSAGRAAHIHDEAGGKAKSNRREHRIAISSIV